MLKQHFGGRVFISAEKSAAVRIVFRKSEYIYVFSGGHDAHIHIIFGYCMILYVFLISGWSEKHIFQEKIHIV